MNMFSKWLGNNTDKNSSHERDHVGKNITKANTKEAHFVCWGEFCRLIDTCLWPILASLYTVSYNI